jgi:hypothetical protein
MQWLRPTAVPYHLIDLAVAIDDVVGGNLPAPDFLTSARVPGSEASVQCKTILSIIIPLRDE